MNFDMIVFIRSEDCADPAAAAIPSLELSPTSKLFLDPDPWR